MCLVLVTWAFVASLLSSTYTASLSSRLTLARLQPSVTNVTQLIKDGSYVGCQEGSFLVNYLKKLQFSESKIKQYQSVGDIHVSLENKNISAYCDVLPHIKHILSQSCGKYMIIEPVYRTDGFAFVSMFLKYLEHDDPFCLVESQLSCLFIFAGFPQRFPCNFRYLKNHTSIDRRRYHSRFRAEEFRVSRFRQEYPSN